MYAIDGFSGHWGQWMLSIAWQLAVLILVLTGLTLLLRKKSAVFLHALWLLVLIRLVLPPAFAFPTGWAWWLRGGSSQQVAQLPADTSRPSNRQADIGDDKNVSQSTVETTVSPNLERETGSRLPEQSGPVTEKAVSPATPQATYNRRSSNVDWRSLLMLGWAGVTLTMIGMLVRGQVLTWQWIRKAKKNDDQRLLDIMSRCSRRLGIKRHIELRNSESCSTPLVVGLFRPIVLLPSSVPEQLSDQELEAVLTHELAHVARHDALINLFQGVLGAIYFFNPLVWFANYQINRLREEACDELTVTALNGRRKAYGSAIIKVTEILGYAPSPLALGIMEVKHSAKRRLSRILDPDLPRGHGLKWSSLIFVAIIGAVLLPSGAKPSAASIAATIAFLSGGNSSGGDAATDEESPTDGTPATESKEKGSKLPDIVEPKPVAKKVAKKSVPQKKTKSAAAKQATTRPPNATAKRATKRPPTKSKRTPKPDKQQRLSAPWRYQWAKAIVYDVTIQAEDDKQVVTHRGTATISLTRQSSGQTSIRFQHHLLATSRTKRRNGFGLPSAGFSFPRTSLTGRLRPSTQHLLTIDGRGQILTIQGNSSLPYHLGNLSQLCILTFPEEAKANWSTVKEKTLTTTTGDPRLTRSLIFRRQSKEKSYAARAKSKYQAVMKDKELVVHQTHDLLTLERIDKRPALKLSGTGTWQFDLRRKVVRRVTLNYKLSDARPGKLGEKTISVLIREVNPDEVKRRRLEAERRRREPLSVAKSDALVEKLLSGDRGKQLSALSALRFANPNSQRDAIVALLTPMLKESDKTVRRAAHHALARWAGKLDVKILAKLLDEDETVLRWAVIDRLGAIQSPLAVKALAGQLSNKHVRGKATDALTKIGAISEPEMIQLLNVKDSDILIAALKVLEKIGSSKSQPALTKIINDGGNPVVRLKAVAARAAIQKRAP